MTGDPVSRQLLTDYAAKHRRDATWKHSAIAHRDLGFCSRCVDSPLDDPRLGASCELSGWRLLAAAERGWPKVPPPVLIRVDQG